MTVMMSLEIRDTDEFIRLIATQAGAMREPLCIALEPLRVHVSGVQYHVPEHVPRKLFVEGFLVETEEGPGPKRRYALDSTRIESWRETERERIESHKVMLEKHYLREFSFVKYIVLQHPESTNNDMRGFMFRDVRGFDYLVTLAGGVTAVPRIIGT